MINMTNQLQVKSAGRKMTNTVSDKEYREKDDQWEARSTEKR
jgi:hypothetical protein